MKNFKKILVVLFSVFALTIVSCNEPKPSSSVSSSSSSSTTSSSSTSSSSSSSTSSEVGDVELPTFDGIVDIEIEIGVAFNPYLGVTATDNVDGDLTSSIDVILPEGIMMVNGKITFTQAGVYTLVYEVEDQAGNKASATRKITVKEEQFVDNTAPVLSGYKNHKIKVYELLDVLDGVAAFDDVDGDIASRIQVKYPLQAIVVDGKVKFETAGTYTITLEVRDNALNKAEATIEIIVEDLDVTAPVITKDPIVSTTNQWISLTSGLTVVDDFDGDITDKTIITLPVGVLSYDNKVKFTEAGQYSVNYKAADSSNNISEKNVLINITAGQPVKTNLVENESMDIGRHILVSNGGSGYIKRYTSNIVVNVNKVAEGSDSIYLERRLVSFTKDLTVTSFNILSVGTGDLENKDKYRVDVGYYDSNNEFVLISSNESLDTLEKFTPPVTTTKGVVRIIFEKTGTFTLKELFLQSGTEGSNPNQIRDTEKGNGFALPYGWYTESTATDMTPTTEYDVDKGNVLKYGVSGSATNARLQYENFELETGKTYVISFDMKASSDLTIKTMVGYHSQSASVSSTLKAVNEFNVNLTTTWTSYSFEFIPTESSPLYKIRFVTVKGNTYYLTNVNVSELVVEENDLKAQEFKQKVYSVTEVTLESEAALDEAMVLYNNLSSADKAKVVDQYNILLENYLYLAGLKNVTFTGNLYYINTNIDLSVMTISPTLGSNITVSFTSNYPEYINGNILNSSVPLNVEVIYTFEENGVVVALYKRIVNVSTPKPKAKSNIIQNYDFSKNKYELYTSPNTSATIARNVDSIDVNITSYGDMAFLERLGVSFRQGAASNNIALTATFEGMAYEDIIIVFGYYLEDNSFFEDYRASLLADGKAATSYIPSLSTNDGVLRIYFTKPGSMHLTKVVYQTGTSGVQNVIRDQAAGGFQGPAYFASGSSAVTSTTMLVENNTLKVTVTSSSSKSFFYENFSLEKGQTYIVSITVKGTVGTQLGLNFASYNQNTTTSSFTSSSATNKLAKTFDLTDEYQTFTFEYAITDTPNSSSGFKVNFSFGPNSETFIKDFTITKVVQ
jgi:hypothetical protein